MEPEVICPVHLVALAEYERAEGAIALACEMASVYVRDRWAEAEAWLRYRDEPNFGLGYWEVHPPAPRGATGDDWGPLWFDWTLKRRDGCLPGSRGGAPVFLTGLSSNRRTRIAGDGDRAAWAAALQDGHGFVEVHDDDDRQERFVRVAYPEQVLVGATLREQGENLGAWVVQAYRALFAAGPPPAAHDDAGPALH